MERYTLKELYPTLNDLKTSLSLEVLATELNMGLSGSTYTEVVAFICSCIYGYFYNDLVAYASEDDDPDDVKPVFGKRVGYDIGVKMPYWYRKYHSIKELLTTDDLSLLQTSKMTSSSQDLTKSAGGSLQKGATTPTGVTTGTNTDAIDITIGTGTSDGDNDIATDGFVDKYTSHQQKFANASRIEGERSGEILREGSIDDLLKVLEKLPSSFADEITRDLQKHFIFDYDGEEKQLY